MRFKKLYPQVLRPPRSLALLYSITRAGAAITIVQKKPWRGARGLPPSASGAPKGRTHPYPPVPSTAVGIPTRALYVVHVHFVRTLSRTHAHCGGIQRAERGGTGRHLGHDSDTA